MTESNHMKNKKKGKDKDKEKRTILFIKSTYHDT